MLKLEENMYRTRQCVVKIGVRYGKCHGNKQDSFLSNLNLMCLFVFMSWVEEAFKLLREKFDNGKYALCLLWFSKGWNQLEAFPKWTNKNLLFVCWDTPTIVNTFPCQLKALHLQCCLLNTSTDTVLIVSYN